MTLEEYQKRAMTTCMTTCENIPYMLFNLQGEVGELSSKMAKLIRKGQLAFFTDFGKDKDIPRWNEADFNVPDARGGETDKAIMAELGDVLWQLSGLCSVLGYSLDDIAVNNLIKLASRQQRGVIDGNGDNR